MIFGYFEISNCGNPDITMILWNGDYGNQYKTPVQITETEEIDCVICGVVCTDKNAVRHMERCYNKVTIMVTMVTIMVTTVTNEDKKLFSVY